MEFKPKSEVGESHPAYSAPLVRVAYDDARGSKKIFSDLAPAGQMLRVVRGSTFQPMQVSGVLNRGNLGGTELYDSSYGTRHLFGLHAARQIVDSTQLIWKATDEAARSGDTLNNLQMFFQGTLPLALPEPGVYRVNLVIGVPVQTLINDSTGAYRRSLRESLEGLHTFEAFTGTVGVSAQYDDWQVLVDRIFVVEQTFGGLLHMALNPDGSGVESLPLSGRCVLLDWGFGTFDMFTVDLELDEDGEPMFERIDALCGGRDQSGLDVLHTYLRDNVFTPYGIYPNQGQLDRAIAYGYYTDHAGQHPDSDDQNRVDIIEHIGKGLESIWHRSREFMLLKMGSLDAHDIANFVLLGGTAGFMRPFVTRQFGAHRVIGGQPETERDAEIPFKHLMYNKLPLVNCNGMYRLAKKLW